MNVVEDMFNELQIPTTFMNSILTKTDFITNRFKDKLNLNYFQSEVVEENIHFLSACARLRGNQNQTISYKEQKDWMLKYEGNIEKQLIMFDEDQRSVLNNFDSRPEIQHFAFRGGSGTGKTLVALKCLNLLISRYINVGHENIFVYALTCQEEPERSNALPLVQEFKDIISSNVDNECNLRFRCETLNELVNEFENLPLGNLHQRIWRQLLGSPELGTWLTNSKVW